jgi:hypothetical protein
MIKIVPLTPELVLKAADDIRGADRREWLAGTGQTVEERLLSDTDWGFTRCALDGQDNVLCFWGVQDAWVWMVATTLGQSRWRSLFRLLAPCLQEMRDLHPGRDLQCYADDRNVLHQQWLRALGFEDRLTEFLGPFGLPFTLFVLKGED